MNNLNDIRGSDMQRHIIFFIFLIALILFALMMTSSVYAAGNIDILEQLNKYELNDISNIFMDCMRSLGFLIVKFFAWLGDNLYKGLLQTFDAVTFSYSDEIINLTERYSVIYKAFFIVAVVGFGLYLIMRKGQQELNTVMCIFIMILIISSMPLMMKKMGELTSASSHYVINQWTSKNNEKMVQSISGTVLNESIVDLRLVDEKMTDNALPGDLKKGEGYNTFNSTTWKSIDINARMDYESSSYNLNHNDVWEYKLNPGEDGEYETEKIDGWTEFTSNYYYRYQVTSWFGIYIKLGSMMLLLFFLILRAAKIIIDLGGAMIYTPAVAVTDLTTGQRIKETIKDVIAHFAALFILAAFMGLYFVAFTWIEKSNLSLVPKLAMHLGLVWAIIDGPDIIERIIGVDAGHSGVWKTILGIKAGADIAHGAGKMAAGAGKAGVNMGKGAGAAAGKTGKGIYGFMFGKEAANNMADKASDMADKVKAAPGEAVHKATDGKGVLGFMQNAEKGYSARFPSDNTTESLNRNVDRSIDPRIHRDINSASENINRSTKFNPVKPDRTIRSIQRSNLKGRRK